MHRLHSGTWCLHEITEGKDLLSASCAYVGDTFNTCACVSINNIQFKSEILNRHTLSVLIFWTPVKEVPK